MRTLCTIAFEIRVQLPDFRASATVVNAALKKTINSREPLLVIGNQPCRAAQIQPFNAPGQAEGGDAVDDSKINRLGETALLACDLALWGQSSGWRLSSPTLDGDLWREPETVSLIRQNGLGGRRRPAPVPSAARWPPL